MQAFARRARAALSKWGRWTLARFAVLVRHFLDTWAAPHVPDDGSHCYGEPREANRDAALGV